MNKRTSRIDDWLGEEPAYQRVVFGDANETDIQWLRLLARLTEGMDVVALDKAGLYEAWARDLCGMVALLPRYEEGQASG